MTDSPAAAVADAGFDFEFIEGGVDPRTLKIHANVRIDPRVEADAEFLDSIRRRGVRTAVNLYRNADGDLVVLRGQRRTLAAVLVGRSRIPAMIEPEPSEADRLADQLIENDKRAGLVAAEHAAAYEQLAVLGMSADDIAAATATPAPQVKAGLAVAGSKKAADAIADIPALDLFRGAVFAEFADDPKALGQLDVAARRGNWDHTVQRLRDDRREKALREAKFAELEAEGLTVLRDLEYVTTYDSKIRRVEHIKNDNGKKTTVAQHRKACKGHAVWVQTLNRGYTNGEQDYTLEVIHVCKDVGRYKHELLSGVGLSTAGSGKVKLADMDPGEAAAQRAENRKTKANNAAMRSATTLRLQFVAELANRKKMPAGAGQIMAAAVFRDRDKMRFSLERSSRVAHTLFGLAKPEWHAHEDFHALSDGVSDLRGELMALVVMLAAYEDNMGDDCWRVKDGGRNRYLLFLKSCGYELSPVEEMAAGLRDVVNIEEIIQEDKA